MQLNSTQPILIDFFYNNLSCVDPSLNITSQLDFNNSAISWKNESHEITGKRISILAFGKASLKMFKGVVDLIGQDRIYRSLIISHDEVGIEKIEISSGIEFILSSHPFVSQKSIDAGSRVLDFCKDLNEEDFVIVLISGGGSAMLASPLPSITYEDKNSFINSLLLLGIGEREVNIFRKALSSIKGGRLAQVISPAKILNLIVSDERNHQVSAIASGPTVNPELDENILELIDRLDLYKIIPEKIMSIFNLTEKRDEFLYENVLASIITTKREMLIKKMSLNARSNGFDFCHVLSPVNPADFNSSSKMLFDDINTVIEGARSGRHLVIGCGEIPVKPVGIGVGGRNQHLVAAFALSGIASKVQNCAFVAIATDGCDFIRGIHGAWISKERINWAIKNNINIEDYVKKTDTYNLHKELGTLVEGDYTGTNVSDFYLFEFEK